MGKDRFEGKIRQTLSEADLIHNLLHPVDDPDSYFNLRNAESQKEDAVRGLVLHLALAMENILDDLYLRAFLGYRPAINARRPRGKRARILEGILKLNFSRKLDLARDTGLITKKQYAKLDALRALRNKCAHNWQLDVIQKRGKRRRPGAQPLPTKRLLEHEGKNLFDIGVLKDLLTQYGPIYLSLFRKLMA